MEFSSPASELIRRRYSCRSYDQRVIDHATGTSLEETCRNVGTGPFGNGIRIVLISTREEDDRALRRLGTYGFIKGAQGFLIGAVTPAPNALVDFGYVFELVILRATDLGLGTCWLGGTFTKSRFARAIHVAGKETMPAASAVGYADERARIRGGIRLRMGMNRRMNADALFFDGAIGVPLKTHQAEPYGAALEAVRWAPSASNKQPWRLVRTEAGYHFYLQRTPRYGKGSLLFTVLRLADLQLLDIGIAMSHFELVARETGCTGIWVLDDPCLADTALRDGSTGVDTVPEYVATWRPD
jgi:nitroreductase